MHIRILTIAHKTPNWLQTGLDEYEKRLQAWCKFSIVEIPAEKRSPSKPTSRVIQLEGEKLLTQARGHYIIVMDVLGKMWTTPQLSEKISTWQQKHSEVDILIGGADGLSHNVLQNAAQVWSLSPLTFPHFFVKLLLAEQLYRAFTILQNHPYHR